MSIEIKSASDGWIVLDVRQVPKVLCKDDRLIVHASYDGEHWFDARERQLFDIPEFLKREEGTIEGAAYVRVRLR